MHSTTSFELAGRLWLMRNDEFLSLQKLINLEKKTAVVWLRYSYSQSIIWFKYSSHFFWSTKNVYLSENPVCCVTDNACWPTTKFHLINSFFLSKRRHWMYVWTINTLLFSPKNGHTFSYNYEILKRSSRVAQCPVVFICVFKCFVSTVDASGPLALHWWDT